MSTTDNTPADTADAQEQYEKDVVITVYADGDFTDAREMLAETFGQISDINLHETETETERHVYLEMDLEAENDDGFNREINEKISPFMNSEQQALANGIDEDDLPDYFTLVDETTETESHVNSKSSVVTEVIANLFDSDVLEDFDYEQPGYKSKPTFFTRGIENEAIDADEDAEIEQHVRISTKVNGSTETRRLLVHQSERSRGNRFETEEEFWSFQIKVSIDATSEEELDAISKRIVAPLYGEMASVPGITNVRISDCQQKVEKSGDCYNL